MKYVRVADSVYVADASTREVIHESVAAAREAVRDRLPQVVTALHIGGLNERKTEGFTDALASSRLVYADGMAVVLLARLSGANVVERSATTDIGIPILESIAADLGRPTRTALLGGEDGVAVAAATTLAKSPSVEIVYTCHGYQDSDAWGDRLAELRATAPDVVFIGLGSPAELLFCVSYAESLPASLIVTCGGWFGFLSGREPRAPLAMRRLGLEWLWRLANAPQRLFARYAKGLGTFLQLASRTATKKALRGGSA